jgi:hypothetical protein
MFPAAIYAVVSFLACVAPKLTFQLYGIIPIPAWLAVIGIFTYDTYSAVSDKVRPSLRFALWFSVPHLP